MLRTLPDVPPLHRGRLASFVMIHHRIGAVDQKRVDFVDIHQVCSEWSDGCKDDVFRGWYRSI